ncbi:MAG: DUF177 domain-containing protein [Bacteroidota bacterium]
MLGVDITALPPGLHQQTHAPVPDDLGLDAGTFGDIVVEVTLDHGEDRDLVAFTARATATLECDRTLKPFRQRVEGSYAVLFVLPERLDQYASDDDSSDDVRPLPDPGQPLDLTEPVRDTLLLSLPTRRVAPGAEDEDLPVQFGALTDEDGNPIDPRWDALRALRDSTN